MLPTYQNLVIPTITMDPRMDEDSRIDVFPYLTLGLVMTDTEHTLLTKFLNIKLPIF